MLKKGIFILTIIVVCFGIWEMFTQPNKLNDNVPSYINRDNTKLGYVEKKEKIYLGRVLFYDKSLSSNNTISCASCHKQEFAFSDTSNLSSGYLGDLTGRHSMRLINSRYSFEEKFFWDERAITLEDQTTKPIRDHVEMGFSNSNGKPGIDSLIKKLEKIDYYLDLFVSAFGNSAITEIKMQDALAQFIRSIQSFDSKYDAGLKLDKNNSGEFVNFSESENRGMRLFMNRPNQNGAGCNRCHKAPEFAIGPEVKNNGIIAVVGDSLATDLNITRSPTLRDLVNPQGYLNGPLMHDASMTSLKEVIEHYNQVPENKNLDNRLRNRGGDLELSERDKVDLENFLLTLIGDDVYSNKKWSSPFINYNTLGLSEPD